MAHTFEIAVEYLHTLIGRRVVIPRPGYEDWLVAVEAIRHHPESGRIVVDLTYLPGGLRVPSVWLLPGTIVLVEHERSVTR